MKGMNAALFRQEGTNGICMECGELIVTNVPIVDSVPYWSSDPEKNRQQTDEFNRIRKTTRNHYAEKHSEYWALRCADHDETTVMKARD